MPDQLQIIVREEGRECFQDTISSPLEIGRQDSFEPAPLAKIEKQDICRLVVAPAQHVSLSRKLLRVELQADGSVSLENLSSKNTLIIEGADRQLLQPKSSCRTTLPLEARVDQLAFAVSRTAGKAKESHVDGFGWQTAPPSSTSVRAMAEKTITYGFDDSQHELTPDLFAWLRDAMQLCMQVFQSARSSEAFFQEGARAVVDIAQLDSGQVLLREGDDWTAKVRFSSRGDDDKAPPPSQRILEKVFQEKRTCWKLPDGDDLRGSIVEISAVVAAPILNDRQEVLGVLYGDRRMRHYGQRTSISKLEALLVELLACGIATGLARIDLESAQGQYEQFFTPNLARRLIDEPELLAGTDREISVMFCDVTGFTGIGESLVPATALEWIHDALTCFSDCVLQTGGVLVDYVGDELMAMWGAPDPVEDHAERACQAAVDIMQALPELNARWQERIAAPTSVCIGINSGTARVGNTGSKQKFKYGALGSTVNLASRVQRASKHLRTRLIISEATSRALPPRFRQRRLCQVRVQGIAAPVLLYELCGAPDGDGWSGLKQGYEQALELAEEGQLREAITALGNLLQEVPDDGPTLVLLSRLVDAVYRGKDRLDPVWELPGK